MPPLFPRIRAGQVLAAISVLAVVGLATAWFFGPQFLEAAYHSRSLPMLNQALGASSTRPLAFYENKFDALWAQMAIGTAYIMGLYMLVLWVPPVLENKVAFVSCSCLGLFVVLTASALFWLAPWGHDLVHHLFRLRDILDATNQGAFPLYLSPAAAEGRGLPVYAYYSQWVYLPPAALTALGASPLASLKMSFAAFFVASAAGSHLLLKRHAPTGFACLGTLLYLGANYVLGNIFVRAAYAEFTAVSVLPFALLGLRDWLVLNRASAAGLAVAALALTVLFHPLSALNAAVLLVAYALFVKGEQTLAATMVVRRIGGLLLATLGVTAFYWLPAIVERPFVQGPAALPVDIRETALPLAKFLAPVDFKSPGPIMTVALLLSLVILGFSSRRWTAACLSWTWLLLAAIVYILLVTEPLSFIWSETPVLESNIFVWRLLQPLALASALLIVLAARAAVKFWHGAEACIAVLAGIAAAAALATLLSQSASHLGNPVEDSLEGQLAAYAERGNGWGVSEYVPDTRHTPPRPAACSGRTRRLAAQAIRRLGPERWQVDTREAAANTCYVLPRFWAPRYAASAGDGPVTVYADRHGHLGLAPDRPVGRVELRIATPAYVRWARSISITAIIALVGYACLRRRATPPG